MPDSPQAPSSAENAYREFVVATWSVGSVESAVKSLARAARRAGIAPLPELTVDWSSQREIKQTRNTTEMADGEVVGESSRMAVVPVVTCRISLPGGRPVEPGDWRVLATLQRVDGDAVNAEVTNEVFTRPVDLPKAETWRHAPLCCEHCKATRRRTKTLVLEQVSTGTTKMVGAECGANYLGDKLEQAVQELQFQQFVGTILSDFEPGEGGYYGGGGGRRLAAWDAEEFMAHAFACVRERGWQPARLKVSTGRYGEEEWVSNEDATSLHVRDVLFNSEAKAQQAELLAAKIAERSECFSVAMSPIIDPESAIGKAIASGVAAARAAVERMTAERERLLRPTYTVTEPDRTQATELIDWLARQKPDPEKDKYLSEMQAVFSAGFISEKRLAFAVSAVRAQINAQRIAEQKAKAAASQFVGTPGAREEFSLKLVAAVPYGGQFPGTAYRLEDSAGNLFSYLTSSGTFGEQDLEREFVLKATIKEHQVYRDTKTTMLTRVKVVREVALDHSGVSGAGGATPEAHARPLEAPRMRPLPTPSHLQQTGPALAH